MPGTWSTRMTDYNRLFMNSARTELNRIKMRYFYYGATYAVLLMLGVIVVIVCATGG